MQLLLPRLVHRDRAKTCSADWSSETRLTRPLLPKTAQRVVAIHEALEIEAWIWSVADPISPRQRLWCASLETPPLDARVGGATVAAIAGSLPAKNNSGLVIAISHDDIDAARGMADAGLELSCWYRSLVLDERATAASADGDEGGMDGVGDLPLPHRHGGRWVLASPIQLRSGHGMALVSPPVGCGERSTILLDPLVGATRRDQIGLITTACDHAERRRVEHLSAVVGPGESHIDDVLAQTGFIRSIDWWWLRPRQH